MNLSNFSDSPRPHFNRIQNKYTQRDKTEHLFRKTPGNFTWDVIPGASGPYENKLQANSLLKKLNFQQINIHAYNRLHAFAGGNACTLLDPIFWLVLRIAYLRHKLSI